MVNWYAVQAKNHNEARVHHRLVQMVIPAFLPLIEVTKHWRSRRVTRLEPLFPGYLFVRMEPVHAAPEPWSALRWTPGVKSVLGDDNGPVMVPDSVIEDIQRRVQDLGFVRPAVPFGPRERVVVRRGPIAGLEAVFERALSRPGRVQVLMQLLGQQRRVQVDAADLEPA